MGVAVLALVLAACAPAPPPPPPPATVYDAACAGTLVASTPGTVAKSEVKELSGIAASRRNPGVWWVHNDSGNPAAVYAVGDNGADLGTFTLTGATNVDWEDIAVGPGPDPSKSYLYVADIGGAPAPPTTSNRASVVVYRVVEPDASTPGPVSGVETLTFTYPSGAKYDAESFMVDPTNGELFVVTKQLTTAKVFRAPANLGAGSTTVMTEVATVPVPGATAAFTGADVTPAGDFVALRTDDAVAGNGSVVIYPRPAGQSLAAAFAQAPCSGATAAEAKGEAIGFTPDGRGYVTASEGTGSELHQFHAP